MNKIKCIIIGLIVLPLISFGQDSDLGNWLIYIGNKKVNSKWNIHHEIQYRNYNAIGDLEQLLIRTGVGHNLTENNNNLLLGYGFILSKNYNDGLDVKTQINEHRIFQQFITKHQTGGFSLQHRFRFEQRFVEDLFKMRFRYFLAATVPLFHIDQNGRNVYFSTYNEIFLNTKGRALDRNRLYGGIGYKASQNFRIELGYLNQFLPNDDRDQLNVFTFLNF